MDFGVDPVGVGFGIYRGIFKENAQHDYVFLSRNKKTINTFQL